LVNELRREFLVLLKNIKGTHEQEDLVLTLPNAYRAFTSHCNLENDLAVLERELHCQLIKKNEDILITASISELKHLLLYETAFCLLFKNSSTALWYMA
jgi:hypothetical protein